jgi:hypothetical protein
VQQSGGGKIVKTAVGSLTIALPLIVTAATAADYILPPKEYDHPYAGRVEVIEARDQGHVRELCGPGAKFGKIGALACSQKWPDRCRIVVSPSALKAAGFALHVAMRHEIGHCNGWPGDHTGALPYEEWVTDDTRATRNCGLGVGRPCEPSRVMEVAAQFDEFARRAVEKTVMAANNLAQSNETASTQLILAAKGIGLAPQSKLTRQVLSNPATAAPLGRAVDIGAELSDEQWQEAHALAFQTARARQAKNAAFGAASQNVPNPGYVAPEPQQVQPAVARATTDVVCAVVLNTPDGFLAVRERAGTQARMTAKLRPGQSVNISSESCVWQSNGNVTCNKWIMVSGSDGTSASGWVRSKYLQPAPNC